MPIRYRTSALALVAVLVLVSIHLYTSVLGGTVGQRQHRVTVELASTGGLFEGSGVTYRGVRVGSVDDVRVQGSGAVARLSLDPRVEVPADTRAVVRSLSPAGEQFLDLQPDRHAAPWLDDGDTIEASATSVPTTVAQTLRSVDDLMAGVDTTALRTTLVELGTAFEDPDDLRRVLDSGSRIVEVLDRRWPETERILVDGRTVLRTGVAVEDDLRRFSRSAASLTAWLAEYDPTLRRNLRILPDRVEDLRSLTSLVALKLPRVLDEMIVFADMTIPREQHLRELLRVFPRGFDRFSEAVKDGRLQTNMLVSPGAVCSYGLPDPSPKHGERQPLDPDRSCPTTFDGQLRGSTNAPLPQERR
jgi:phospholipid/cholesterol/gamma-HCH transport system substrate-binding protein